MRAGGAPVAALLLFSASLLIQVSSEDIYWEGEEDASNEFLEVKEHDDSIIGHLSRIKRDWGFPDFFSSWSSTSSTTAAPENIEDGTEDPVDDVREDDVDADAGSGAPGLGYAEPREKTLRVTFVAMQPYQDEYSNRDSPQFRNFSKSLENAVNKIYEEQARNRKISGNQKASLVRIQSRTSDDFSCKVTMDIVTTGYYDMDRIIEILRNHIQNRRSLEGVVVSDSDFSANVIDPGTSYANDACPPDWIRCNTGACVPGVSRCNGVNDCPDGVDEAGCPPDTDNEIDRGDLPQPQTERPESIDPEPRREPEVPENSSPKLECHNDELQCDYTRCVSLTRRCDGYKDCDDNSDEMNCKPIEETCSVDSFRCSNGKCIARDKLCDDVVDCSDGVDELNCGTQPCASGEFTCPAESSSRCGIFCDGNRDCDNGEDELDCPDTGDECEHQCNGRCLDASLICNGEQDCPDGTDELNCDNCDGPDDFRCTNGECLRKPLRCNGLPDCSDQSDEENCSGIMISTPQCTSNQFQCTNGSCIDLQFWCDGQPDCIDGSDEENCRCRENQKQCRSGVCIPESQFCDGYVDCSDGSDEENCAGFDDYVTTTTWRPVYTTTPRPSVPDYPPRPAVPDYPPRPAVPDYTPRPQYPRTEYPPYPQRPDNGGSRGPVGALKLKTYPTAQTVRNAKYQTGGDVVFQCRDEGPLREPVRWIREGGRPLKINSTDIAGRLELSKVSTSDSGVYICQAYNYVGTPGSELRVTLVVENPSTTLRPPFISCQPNEATCINGQCIPKSAVCDGRYDCADQSDEETCHQNGVCEPNQFHCDNRRCILKSWVCDLEDDCGDSSDERNCGVAKPGEACSPAEFTCHDNNQCIPRSFHCDGHRDCLDASDESGCIGVHVTKPPQPAQVRLNPGESLRLECEAAGVPMPFINWRLNWGHVPAKCSSTSENGIGILSCTDMQPEDSGAYSCEAVNNKGTSFGAPDSIVIVNRTSVCPRGYFNSEARSPSECIRCFCFGESTQCKSADLFIYNMPTPLGEGGTRLVGVQQDYNGGIKISSSPITDQYYYQPLRNGATVTKLEVYGYPTSTDSHPYLTLPESYNGNQLTSYGGYIRYRVSPQSPRLNSGYESNMPDVIIKGKHETLIYNRRRYDPRDTNIEVRLTQDEWKKSTPNGLVPAAREDVMMALDNVELILLRASVNGAGVNITDFAMESAQSINMGLGAANLVEECTCPPGYEGLSCQKCSSGFVRESSGAWLGNCVREAPRRCPSGMYGDPSSGAGCQPCPCPLTNPENQFARTCSVGPRGNVICDCAPGYEGEQCQHCSEGFVGNPLVAGDSCQRQVTSNCNPIGTLISRQSDQCECKQNVQGQFCDQCKDESFHLSEDNRHGCAQCFCTGVTKSCTSSNLRRKTTTVTYNTPQIVNEVTVYQSTPVGEGGAIRYEAPVETSVRPQLVRGELVLDSVQRSQDNIYYWSLPPSFALDKVTAYGGYLRYVLQNVPTSGDSNKAPDIQLISYNRLTFHYYGNFTPSEEGTLDASVQFLERGWHRADGKGTTRQHFLLALADVKAILVKATYTTNYQIASLVSSSIDTADENGNGPLAAHVEQCVCPEGYLGTSCEDCAPGYTRSPRALYLKLCKPCECNGHSKMCDPETGECFECQHNTAGPSCEECKSGYRRDVYSNCVPENNRWPDRPGPEPDSCNCDASGTIDDGPRCDDRGNCNCKHLVEGEACDRCRPRSFGLSQDNPDGCIECYCSGVTSECYEVNNLFWDQVPAPIIGDLNYNNYTIMDLKAKKVINNHFVPILEESELMYTFSFSPDEELFWSLPLLTLPGNNLLSYGGNLTFKQKFEVDNVYPVYNNPGTDVVLVGDADSVYWTNPQSFRSGEYLVNQVPLLERNWFVLNTRTPASRPVFMGVLKNLRQVLVRATLADLKREKLSSTSIATVAMDKAGEERRPIAAKGIEVCRCPDGYSGRSCESCTAGYYKQQGRCLQCNCNGHNCHVANYDQVVCDCPTRYSGPDCSVIDESSVTTSRSPPPQSSVTVTISSPTIKIQSVGGYVNFTCEATSRYRQGPLPVTWVKKNGYLPQGRYVIDQDTGTLTITQVQVSDSGTYICQTSDGIQTGQASATLTVGSNPMTRPTVSIRPSVQEYYEGDRIELECVTSGNPTPTIDWRRGNGQTLPMTVQHFESYLIIENAKEEDSGDYRCLASNNVGSVDRIASITVRPRPDWPSREKLTISPSTPNVVEGQNTNVVCTGTANIPPGSIRWVRQDGADFASNVQSQNGVLYIDVARLENEGVYTCQASSDEAEPKSVLVTVVRVGTQSPAESPKIEVNVNDLKIPTGEVGTVDCNPGGYPLPRIQWTKHEGEFGSGTSQRGNTLVISNAQDDDRGYYVCTGTVDGTPVATTYVNVDIETRIRPRVQIWPQRDVRARIGDQFELRCQVLDGVPPPVILWSRSKGRELSSDAQVGPAEVIKFSKIDVNDEGEYICSAENKAGNDTASAVLKVWSPPEITITPDRLVSVNTGDPVEIKCRANGYPEPMVSIKLRERSGTRVVVPPTPSVATLRIQSASDSDEGDYLCSASFLDQSIDDQFTVRVERGDIGFGPDEGSGDVDPFNPDQQPRASDLLVAEGQDTRLGCNYSGSYDYELTWSRLDQRPLQRNAQQIGNDLIIRNATKQDSAEYECNVVDRRTGYALHTAYVSLVVQKPPRITLRPMTQTVSPGQSPTVECIVEGDDIIDISWNPNEKPFSRRVEVRESTLIFRRIEVEDAGNYTCTARNRLTPASAVAQVLVSGPREEEQALVRIDQPRRDYQVGDNVEIVCRALARSVDVAWQRYGTRQHVEQRAFGDGSSLIINSLDESDAGVYRCTGTDQYGRASYEDFSLQIQPAPVDQSYPPRNDDTTITARLGQPVYIPCPRYEDSASVEWRREYSTLAPNIRANEPNLYIGRVSEADAGTYICRVSNGRTRSEARVVLLVTGVVPQFNRYSWLAMPTLSDAYTQFDIEISFKPTDSDGLILFDNGRSGHFVALRLINAQPEVILDYGSGPISLIGDRPLALNVWHTVRLSRMNTKVTMNVDDAGPFTTEIPTSNEVMEFDQPLHIGGVPDTSLLPAALAGTEGFSGCVGMLVLGKEEKDIMMDSYKNRVTECDSCTPNQCLHGGVCQEARNERGFVCLCPAGFAGQNCDHAGEGCRPNICGPGKCTEIGDTYKCSCPITHTGHNCDRPQSIEYPAFTGSAYLAIRAPESKRGLYMKLKIKAMSPVTDGIIMYCAESEQGHGGFTSLSVRERRLEFRYQTGEASQPIVLTSHRDLRPNEWTEVTIARTGAMLRLRINQNTDSVSSVLPPSRQAGDLHLKTAMYVGGVDDSNIILNNNTGVSGGFSGCIKDVLVQDSAVNIVNASIISANVQECSSYDRGDIPDESGVCGRCRNDGRCTSPDATSCTCPPGYSGIYCQDRVPQSPCSPSPCKHGTCRIDRNSRLNYTCDCPLGFSGTNCHIRLELRQSVAFEGNGYVEVAAEHLNYDEDPVEFGVAIITTSADGVLLYQREVNGGGQGDYILLRLENARAVLELDLGDGPLTLTEEGVDVSNGERHVIIVRIYRNKQIELAVEGRSKIQTYEGLTSRMNADSNIYIGGMPEALNVWRYPGMIGCFESIQLNKNHRQSLNLNVAAVAGRNTQRCKDVRRN